MTPKNQLKEIEKDKNNQHLLIVTGFSCNNNCILCSLRPQAVIHNDKTTQEIENMLKSAAKKFSVVEFTGGEPTIRKDLCRLIRCAKKLGFKKIAISTNGRLLSYKSFLDKLIDAGLNRVTLTLYSHSELIHNSITRTPESFQQTVSGIYNLIQRSDIELSVNTVICRLNYQSLNETGMFLRKIGVKKWGLLDLIPFGNAERFYSGLAVKMKDLSSALNKLTEIINDFYSITFFDFSTCLFDDKLKKYPQADFFDAWGRADNFQQVGYNHKRFHLGKG